MMSISKENHTMQKREISHYPRRKPAYNLENITGIPITQQLAYTLNSTNYTVIMNKEHMKLTRST